MPDFQWKAITCDCDYGEPPQQGCPQHKMEHGDKCTIWVKEYPEDTEVIAARERVKRKRMIENSKTFLAQHLGVSADQIKITVETE